MKKKPLDSRSRETSRPGETPRSRTRALHEDKHVEF